MSTFPTNSFESKAIANVSATSGSPTTLITSSDIPLGGYALVLSIIVANKSAGTRDINLRLNKQAGSNAMILSNVAVPAKNSFEVMNGNKFVLNYQDSISAWVDSEGANNVDIVVSYVIYTPATA
jgi:hypothetical protein